MAPPTTTTAAEGEKADDMDYVSFEQPTKVPKPQPSRLKLFLPIYASTACVILFFRILSAPLQIVLVSIWAITFIATPLYYLYHYDPDSLEKVCGQDTTIKPMRRRHAAPKTTTKQPASANEGMI